MLTEVATHQIKYQSSFDDRNKDIQFTITNEFWKMTKADITQLN